MILIVFTCYCSDNFSIFYLLMIMLLLMLYESKSSVFWHLWDWKCAKAVNLSRPYSQPYPLPFLSHPFHPILSHPIPFLVFPSLLPLYLILLISSCLFLFLPLFSHPHPFPIPSSPFLAFSTLSPSILSPSLPFPSLSVLYVPSSTLISNSNICNIGST